MHCYFVVELKTVEFEPEFAGKLSFYLSAVDGELKSPNDNPTIGLLLCKGKDKMVAEYALKDVNKPMGVSEYKLSNHISKELQDKLPSIEDIEKRINWNFASGWCKIDEIYILWEKGYTSGISTT